MLGSRQLGSFQLAGGAGSSGGGGSTAGLWRESDAFIASSVDTDAALAFFGAEAVVVAQDSEADVVPYETDADVYL